PVFEKRLGRGAQAFRTVARQWRVRSRQGSFPTYPIQNPPHLSARGEPEHGRFSAGQARALPGHACGGLCESRRCPAAEKNFSPQLNKLFAESLYEIGWLQKRAGEGRPSLLFFNAAARTEKTKAA